MKSTSEMLGVFQSDNVPELRGRSPKLLTGVRQRSRIPRLDTGFNFIYYNYFLFFGVQLNFSSNARSRSFSKHSVNVFSPQVHRPVGPEIQQICHRYVKWKFKVISLSSREYDKRILIVACHKSILNKHILATKSTNSCVTSQSHPTGLWILYIRLLCTVSLSMYP